MLWEWVLDICTRLGNWTILSHQSNDFNTLKLLDFCLLYQGLNYLFLICCNVVVDRYSGWIVVGSALGVSVYTGDGPASRDVESGNDERNQPGAGTVWRSGKQQAMGPTTTQAMHSQQDAFPGSGRTLSSSSGNVMNSLWTNQHASESKNDRAEMAARRLAALGRSTDESSSASSSLNQYVAGVAAAPNPFASNLKALTVAHFIILLSR